MPYSNDGHRVFSLSCPMAVPILQDEARKTCFRDTPHQCPEFSEQVQEAESSCGAGGCRAAADATAAADSITAAQ